VNAALGCWACWLNCQTASFFYVHVTCRLPLVHVNYREIVPKVTFVYMINYGLTFFFFFFFKNKFTSIMTKKKVRKKEEKARGHG